MRVANQFKFSMLTIILLCINVRNGNAQLKSVDYWEGRFLKSWDKEYKIAKKMSLSDDSWQFYNLAYYIDANTTMYRATKDKKYIDRSIEYTLDMIKTAKPSNAFSSSQYKDWYLGWVNHSAPSYKNDGKEYPLFESYVWRYVSDLLLVMNQNKLNENVKYQKDYDLIYNFTLKNIYEKWRNRGENNLYRSNTHMMSHWVKISMNLYVLTGNEEYKPIIDDFLKKFRSKLEYKAVNKSEVNIKWKTAWNRDQVQYQDVGHGNAVVDVLISLYENKMGVTYDEIQNLIFLFNNTIWKSKDSFSKYVDGTGVGSGWFSDGWIKLGRFDKKIQKRIETHHKGRTTQFFSNAALNALILQE